MRWIETHKTKPVEGDCVLGIWDWEETPPETIIWDGRHFKYSDGNIAPHPLLWAEITFPDKEQLFE